ncbi:MAG: cell division protein FtsA [Pseudomonadota bacterium]
MAHTHQTSSASPVIGLLDIGSAKVACAIVEIVQGPSGARRAGRVLGVGHHKSKGITSGVVTNLDQAEASVRGAVSQAERRANRRIERVVATVACGRISSQRFKAHVTPATAVVDADDMARLRQGAETYARRGGRLLIHLNLIDTALDGQGGLDTPVGFGGEKLTGTYHAVTGDEGPIRNLNALISRSYLVSDALVPAPVASALSVSSNEERQLGCTVIDMGGGTISFADYDAGRLSGCGVLPFGGELITFDIARRFGTSIQEAERIKTLYATMAQAPSDADRPLDYVQADDRRGDGRPMTHADLARVVATRVTRQLATLTEGPVGASLVHDGPGEPRPVVLTGGASLLSAIGGRLAATLGRPVRLAAPHAVPGLEADLARPQFASLWGLSHCLPKAGAGAGPGAAIAGFGSGGTRHGASIRPGEPAYADRVHQWVKEAF